MCAKEDYPPRFIQESRLQMTLIPAASATQGYQVTPFGKETIAKFGANQFKSALGRFASGVAIASVGRMLPILLAFLLGMICWALWGFDLSKLHKP